MPWCLPATARIVDIVSSPPDPFALGTQPNSSSEHYGAQAFSDDARYVVFDSSASNLVAGDDNHDYDTFLRDRVSGTLTLVSHRPDGAPGSDQSYDGAVSGNGRYVAFWSYAPDLVAGDENGEADVFVFDRTTGLVERESVGAGGTQADGISYAPALSRDGRYVLFLSDATNLVAGDTNGTTDAFVRDRQLGLTLRVSVGSGGVQ
ncbi:MAG TPA: hypothetical protein VFO79_14540, partial [Xanthomonadales bacterium]|nr:hypothetical protein [Xanthomonadales bacterium]